MRAVADRYGVGDAALRAVRAGSDLLLVCNTPELVREARDALAHGIEAGQIGAATLADAAARRKKLAHRVEKLRTHRVGLDAIGCEDHRSLASRLVLNL